MATARVQSGVARAIDLAHTACPDGRLDDIRAEAATDGERHGSTHYMREANQDRIHGRKSTPKPTRRTDMLKPER